MSLGLRSVVQTVARQRVLPSSSLSALALVLLGAAASTPLHAQLKAKVTVDTSKTTATFYSTSLGIAADRWDDKAFEPATVDLLQDAGITNIRFPGNNGTAGLYHFSKDNVINPYSNDKVADFPPSRRFGNVSSVIDKLGTALITVDYGSNLDGTGGGEPAEAAAWVAYLNGKPDNALVIGKDSKGNDWKTVSFWATLRGASPLPTDDGYNALRIGHSDPFGIVLWTIGNDEANNGYYGQGRGIPPDWKVTGLYGQTYPVEPDLHAGPVATAKDWGNHMLNAKVGPVAYGNAVVEFAKAMKAVDPTILVGASLTMPPIYSSDPHPYGKNWNQDVLKAACGSMDFSAIGFSEGEGAPPDYDHYMDESALLLGARYPLDRLKFFDVDAIEEEYVVFASDLSEKYKKFCPAGHYPQVAVTGLGINGWHVFKNPAAGGVFAADAVAEFLEKGVFTVIWNPIHGASPYFLDENNKPQPAFYGLKIFRKFVQPGDAFVSASTPLKGLGVHAVKTRNGGLGLLLVNRNSDRSVTATITIDNYTYATTGTRYDWGKAGGDPGGDVTSAPIDKLGGTFTVEVPRYGIVAIVIPKA